MASEILGVPEDIFRRAVDEAARRDPDLAVMEVSGKKILKRARV